MTFSRRVSALAVLAGLAAPLAPAGAAVPVRHHHPVRHAHRLPAQTAPRRYVRPVVPQDYYAGAPAYAFDPYGAPVGLYGGPGGPGLSDQAVYGYSGTRGRLGLGATPFHPEGPGNAITPSIR